MNKISKIFLLLLFLLFLFFLIYVLFLFSNLDNYSLKETLNEINKKSFITKKESENLSRNGVLKWTNYERELREINLLLESSKLNIIAEIKLNDMINRQYFDHFSPDGKEINYLAELENYEYLRIGENLAMGKFENDKSLVLEWMDSPGHRENIIDPGYKEIGIAVKKDFFENKETWIGVQVFALPLSACPKPDSYLINKINQKKETSEKLYSEILIIKKEINEKKKLTNVKKHNSLVMEYNYLLKEIKNLIYKYNIQVNSMNNCIENYGL